MNFNITKITRPIVQIAKGGLRFLSKNSNVVLTIISASGVLMTVYLTIKGTIKAVKICEERKLVGTKEILRETWKCFIPTIGIVFITTSAILCNGKINAKRLAVLTSAYSGSVETIKKIEEKMAEQIGPKKTQKAVDEAECANAQANMPTKEKDIIATGKGSQLFYFATTGQWFYSDRNGVEKGELKLQRIISDAIKCWGAGEYVTFGEAQEALDLPVTDMGEYMGWCTDDFVDDKNTVHFVISSDWMDTPTGKQVVGVVRVEPYPNML